MAGATEVDGVEMRVLGPMEAVNGARPVDLGSRMHRAVLSMLVMDANRVVSSDRLVDGLWREEPPPTAGKALHVYISGLRKALEPGRRPGAPSRVLLTQPPGYVLRVPNEAIDARRFEALAGEGRDLLRAGRPGPACEVLRLALGLWRGSAYQDLAFESHLQGEIARLTELRALTAELRAEALLAAGRHAEAVVDVESMVEEDPLRERRWALLALALYRAGRQADALRALDRARRTLCEELGLDLGPELRRLEQDILVQSADLEWRPPVEGPATATHRVPLRHANTLIRSLVAEVARTGGDQAEEGRPLPPDACPLGFSLAEMAAAAAPFAMTGNDPDRYPRTPFQILYVEDLRVEMLGAGALATGTQDFTVAAGTHLYVPIFVLNDRPPVAPGYPATDEDAPAYFFDNEHYGGRDFEVVVDGTTTPIGAEYLTGPFPVPGDEQHHIITLAAFLPPLHPGTHTVTIRGGLFGRGLTDYEGIAFMQENFTYRLHVLPASPPG